MESVLIYLLAGLIAGFVSGLFGLGGGLTIVPALVLALPLEGVDQRYVMHLAIGTSLAVLFVTAVYTTALRHRRGDLDWPMTLRLGAIVLLGAWAGAAVGDALPGSVLRALFIGFVIFTVGRALLRQFRDKAEAAADPLNVPKIIQPHGPLLWVYGLLTGLAGALMGMGAAILTVPYLRTLGHPIQRAAATAAALSAVIGIGAGIGYVIGGLNETGLPRFAVGYLYLPAFAGLAAGAVAGSPLGVRASHTIDEAVQFWLFLGYLVAVLVAMVYG